MRFKKAPLVDVVRRELKEQKITSFLTTYIAAISNESPRGRGKGREFLLLARSPCSPVAKSIAGMDTAIQDAGIILRVIFSQVGTDAATDAWTSAGSGIKFAREIRSFDNRALLDAHEQLILSPDTSWVGDCMRRDPQRNDAYECYANSCVAAARSATNSFERLWLKADSVVSCGSVSEAHDPNASQDSDSASADSDVAYGDDTSDDGGPMAATRH